MVKPTIKSTSESQDLLTVLSHCKPKIRKAILRNCENDLIHIIRDCVYNVVKGNVPGLTQEKVNKLARHKTSLVTLTKKVPVREKRKILIQKGGGFLPPLLPLVAPLIAVYLTQQEILKFMKEKRQDSLSRNLRKYYEAREEMNEWLEKDDVPEDTKATVHTQQLQRVKQLKNEVFRPEPSPVQLITQTERTMTLESDSVTPSQQLNATEKQIIDSVPKTMQNHEKITDSETEGSYSDVIGWNDNGQLVLEGSIVTSSNIVDLVE